MDMCFSQAPGIEDFELLKPISKGAFGYDVLPCYSDFENKLFRTFGPLVKVASRCLIFPVNQKARI